MKSLTAAVALAIACTLIGPRPAQAWHKEGHMAVALIAYRKLDEGDQKKVLAVLKEHPHYAVYLAAEKPVDAPLDEWVVMRASDWPDWIKSPRSAGPAGAKIKTQFGHSNWHFADKAILRLDDASPEEKEQITQNSKKNGGEVLSVLPILLDGVAGKPVDVKLNKFVLAAKTETTLTNAEARAIALCWILHLVGDIHQPLHAASMFSKDLPKGDAGGNDFLVHWQKRAVDLHSIWDGAFGWDDLQGPNDSEYTVVNALVRDLGSRIKPTDAAVQEMSLAAWADESFALAKSKAYLLTDDGKMLPGVFVGFHEHKPHASEISPLPVGYARIVQDTAEQRVTLAGLRLGTVLKGLVKDD